MGTAAIRVSDDEDEYGWFAPSMVDVEKAWCSARPETLSHRRRSGYGW